MMPRLVFGIELTPVLNPTQGSPDGKALRERIELTVRTLGGLGHPARGGPRSEEAETQNEIVWR